MATVTEMIETMKTKLTEAQNDVDKFDGKGNKSAGVRLRKVFQEIKKDAQDIRIAINDMIKQSKEKK